MAIETIGDTYQSNKMAPSSLLLMVATLSLGALSVHGMIRANQAEAARDQMNDKLWTAVGKAAVQVPQSKAFFEAEGYRFEPLYDTKTGKLLSYFVVAAPAKTAAVEMEVK